MLELVRRYASLDAGFATPATAADTQLRLDIGRRGLAASAVDELGTLGAA